MGIKFHCPNGHKLHVKSFLAGRRGICPDCGAKFEIPAAPANDNDDDEGSDVSEPFPAPSAPAPAPATTAPRGPVPQMKPAGAAMSAQPAGMLPQPAGMMPQPVGMMQPSAPYANPGPMPGMAPSPGYAPAQVVPLDPLLEAPQANWYVRPPSGGQYGPAQGDMVRRWIGEGRLTADSYVWREGWPDWLLASQALAMHFAATAPAPQPTAYAPQQAGFGAGLSMPLEEPSPLARPHSSRRKTNNNSVVIITVVLAVFLMFASLGFVYYWVNYLSDQ